MRTPSRGERFDGRYEILGRLGAGAAGAVLDANDLDRRGPGSPRVAIKLLHPELAKDEEILRRFDREAALLRSLRHPAIVKVRASGHAEGYGPYLVMERLDGRTLRGRLDEGPMPIAELVPIVDRVASALNASHAHGVLHGDVKPENVFLTDNGAVLVDFGSSKVLGLPRLTATGDVAGTPTYLAPEIILGARRWTRASTHTRSGWSPTKPLSGHPPFGTRHPGRLVAAIVAGATAPLPETVTADAAACVAQAMHRDPEQRFLSPTAFATALGGCA